MNARIHARGLTLSEILVTAAALTLLAAMAVPLLGGSRDNAGVMTSMSNLQTLSQAYALYEADFKGRQYTNAADDLSAFSSVQAWEDFHGGDHPPVLLGYTCSEETDQSELYGFWMAFPSNNFLLWPIHPNSRFGWFRLTNGKAIHDYINGRFYDPVFYAPNDQAPWKVTKPLHNVPCEFIVDLDSGQSEEIPYWSSYCLSPAALFDPLVMDRENPQLYVNLVGLPPTGFTCPTPSQARYASLKTRTIEHNWNQNPPAMCNPAYTSGAYEGCTPYFFNHGLASAPVSMFYDGSIRLLPNTQALAAHESVQGGLWFEPGMLPVGAGLLHSDGYYNSAGFEDLTINHTILTIDGILGRDTIEGAK